MQIYSFMCNIMYFVIIQLCETANYNGEIVNEYSKG